MHQILFVIHLALLQKLLIGLSILVPVAFIATTLYGWAKYKQADLLSPIIGIAIGVGIFVGRSYIQHDLSVYAFGVMMVLGFFAAIQLAKFLARHSRIDPEVFVNAGLIALITGVAGRGSHTSWRTSAITRIPTCPGQEPLERRQHPQRRTDLLRRVPACHALHDRLRPLQESADPRRHGHRRPLPDARPGLRPDRLLPQRLLLRGRVPTATFPGRWSIRTTATRTSAR